jgi:hypothetical protein
MNKLLFVKSKILCLTAWVPCLPTAHFSWASFAITTAIKNNIVINCEGHVAYVKVCILVQNIVLLFAKKKKKKRHCHHVWHTVCNLVLLTQFKHITCKTHITPISCGVGNSALWAVEGKANSFRAVLPQQHGIRVITVFYIHHCRFIWHKLELSVYTCTLYSRQGAAS